MSKFMSSEPARVKCVIFRETEKALFIGQGNELRIWIPRSQCSHISKLGRNKAGFFDATIEMQDWLAEEKGFNYA